MEVVLRFLFFSFFFLPSYDVNLLMHRVERVCTNRTRSTHGPFAYCDVSPTLPSLEPSLTIIIILVHRVERVCPNRTHSPHGPFAYDVEYATLPFIEPSLGWFYGMLWSWRGVCRLPMPLYSLLSHHLADSMGCCGLNEVYVAYLCHFTLYWAINWPILGRCGGLEEVHVDYLRVSYLKACLMIHTPNWLLF